MTETQTDAERRDPRVERDLDAVLEALLDDPIEADVVVVAPSVGQAHAWYAALLRRIGARPERFRAYAGVREIRTELGARARVFDRRYFELQELTGARPTLLLEPLPRLLRPGA